MDLKACFRTGFLQKVIWRSGPSQLENPSEKHNSLFVLDFFTMNVPLHQVSFFEQEVANVVLFSVNYNILQAYQHFFRPMICLYIV